MSHELHECIQLRIRSAFVRESSEVLQREEAVSAGRFPDLQSGPFGRSGTPAILSGGVLAAITIDRQIAELTALRESIKETLELRDRRLSQTPEGRPAHLLEALPTAMMQPPLGRRLPAGDRDYAEPTTEPCPEATCCSRHTKSAGRNRSSSNAGFTFGRG